MSDFKIKRGMVFYLEKPAESQPVKCISSFTPEKKRPYIVVSNDKCNEYSQLVNIAPIYSREPRQDKWYQVPFKSTCNRDCIVNIGEIMLVPKELLNENSYSAAVTQYTIANSVLLEAIGRAIHRQFDVSEEIPERVVTPTVSPIPSQGITLNININGMSATPKVSTDENNINLEFTSSPLKEKDPVKKEDLNTSPKKSKKIEIVTKTSMEKTPFRKLNLTRYIATSEEDKKYIAKVVEENYVGFGGTMSYQKIADRLGVSVSTVRRISLNLNRIKIDVPDKKVEVPKHGKTKFRMTPEQEKELWTDYQTHNAAWLLKKYKKCGFTNTKQIYGKLRGIQNKMNKMKVK